MIKIILEGLNFPEGPSYDSQGTLWIVELKGGCIGRMSSNGTYSRIQTGGAPNGIAIDADDNIWFCDSQNDCISVMRSGGETVEKICSDVDGEILNHPNDLAFDARGNVVFTCPGSSRYEPTGYVCARANGKVKKIAENLFFPNGLAFSADGNKLAIAETYKHRIWIGDWNAETAKWSNQRILAEVGGPIGPDGMAFDEDGNLYAAVYGQGAVKVISPDGKVSAISLPGDNPSNCAFAPDGGLVVTETQNSQLLFIDNKVKGQKLFKPKMF